MCEFQINNLQTVEVFVGCYILLSECAPADDCLRGAAAGGRSATSNIVDQKWKKNIIKKPPKFLAAALSGLALKKKYFDTRAALLMRQI